MVMNMVTNSFNNGYDCALLDVVEGVMDMVKNKKNVMLEAGEVIKLCRELLNKERLA